MEKRLIINSFSGKYDFLSNFYHSPITLKMQGQSFTFPTVENAFQAAKSTGIEEIKRFLSLTPGQAKRLGRKVTLRPKWEENKIAVMFLLLTKKFKDTDLRDKLLATEDAQLMEGNNWGDNFWGVADPAKGQNNLGILLMKVRELIQIEIEKENLNNKIGQ